MRPGNFRRMGLVGKIARRSARQRAVFKIPETELEAAIQHYVNLFEFTPMAYVVSTVSVESKRLTSPRSNFWIPRARGWSASHLRFSDEK